MSKKKILKIVVVILAMIILLFLINLGRKVYILSKYSDECKEYLKVTNFYVKKSEKEGFKSELWRKDNIALLKLTLVDEVRMIYFGEDYNWIIVDNNGVKTAVKMSKEGSVPELQTLVSGTLSMDDWKDVIIAAFSSKITTEKINDIECYKIYLDKDWQMFISKKDFLLIREINGSTDTGIIEYKLNEIKDEDVIMPSLEGYTIQDLTQNTN